jgi:hypothetical protein
MGSRIVVGHPAVEQLAVFAFAFVGEDEGVGAAAVADGVAAGVVFAVLAGWAGGVAGWSFGLLEEIRVGIAIGHARSVARERCGEGEKCGASGWSEGRKKIRHFCDGGLGKGKEGDFSKRSGR